jgi:hypothetical protein
MEISVLPPISRRIIDPQEYSMRVMVSNEIEDHFTMGGRPKGLGCSKICLGVDFQIRGFGTDNLGNDYFAFMWSFDFFRLRLWMRVFMQILGVWLASI